MPGIFGSTTASDIIAAVGAGVGTNFDQLYLVAAAAVAIPLAFWVLHAVIGLFPRSRTRRP